MNNRGQIADTRRSYVNLRLEVFATQEVWKRGYRVEPVGRDPAVALSDAEWCPGILAGFGGLQIMERDSPIDVERKQPEYRIRAMVDGFLVQGFLDFTLREGRSERGFLAFARKHGLLGLAGDLEGGPQESLADWALMRDRMTWLRKIVSEPRRGEEGILFFDDSSRVDFDEIARSGVLSRYKIDPDAIRGMQKYLPDPIFSPTGQPAVSVFRQAVQGMIEDHRLVRIACSDSTLLARPKNLLGGLLVGALLWQIGPDSGTLGCECCGDAIPWRHHPKDGERVGRKRKSDVRFCSERCRKAFARSQAKT